MSTHRVHGIEAIPGLHKPETKGSGSSGIQRLGRWALGTPAGRVTTGVVAGAGIISAVTMGLAPKGGETPTTPVVVESEAPTPDYTDEPTPVETDTPTTPEVESDGDIRVEAGLSNEEAAHEFEEQFVAWMMAGTDKFADAWLQQALNTNDASNEAFEAFREKWAQEETEKYVSALFGRDLEEIKDQETLYFIEGTKRILKLNLYLAQQTDNKYEVSLLLDDISVTKTPDGRKFVIDITGKDNAKESGAQSILNKNDITTLNGDRRRDVFTTRVVDGYEYINTIDAQDLQ